MTAPVSSKIGFIICLLLQYATVEEAVVARGRLHNIVWPTCSPKTLKVDYSDSANVSNRALEHLLTGIC